jgi:hypothetical protein
MEITMLGNFNIFETFLTNPLAFKTNTVDRFNVSLQRKVRSCYFITLIGYP